MHFPSSKRDAAEKLYISAEHEKSGYGRDSPGDHIFTSSCSAHLSIRQSSSVSNRGPTLSWKEILKGIIWGRVPTRGVGPVPLRCLHCAGPSAYNTSPERHQNLHTHSGGIKARAQPLLLPASFLRAVISEMHGQAEYLQSISVFELIHHDTSAAKGIDVQSL